MMQLPLPSWPWLLLAPSIFSLVFLGVLELMVLARLAKAPGSRANLLAWTPFGAIMRLGMAFWAQHQDRLAEYFASYYDHLGPSDVHCVELVLLGGRLIFTEEPEHVKAMLSSSFATFGKGQYSMDILGPFLGRTSIFAVDGEGWHQARGLLRPMFAKERMNDMDLLDRSTQVLLTQIPASGQTFDMCELFFRLSMDVTTDFLLGESIDSLGNPDDDFSRTFDHVQHEQMALYTLGISYNRGIKKLEQFIQPYIENTLALTPDDLEKLSKSDKDFNFLHSVALATRDRTVIRDQLISVLLAGRDTTAATLSWMIYEISNYPEVWQKLRKLVLEKFGPSRQPSYRELKDCAYLTHCLNETLRLYPVIASNTRVGLCDTTLPGKPGQPDITVLEGDKIMYNVHSMQRRKDLYPPVSEKFADPSIWSPDRWENWRPQTWQFVPFNAGPRVCIGQDFAMTEMAFVVVRLLQKYERIEYRGDWAAQYYQTNSVGRPGKGVPVALFEADRS